MQQSSFWLQIEFQSKLEKMAANEVVFFFQNGVDIVSCNGFFACTLKFEGRRPKSKMAGGLLKYWI